MKAKYLFLIVWGTCCIGFVSLIAIFSPIMWTQAAQTSSSKEGSMEAAVNTTGDSPAIPPIDAAAPAVFETASFGLG